jgi:hypothetical protein
MGLIIVGQTEGWMANLVDGGFVTGCLETNTIVEKMKNACVWSI